MILVEILLYFLLAAFLIPVLVLFIQVLMSIPAYRTRGMPEGRRPTAAIVIPAHNEALLIASTLRTIIPQLAAGDRVLVVADNCTDATAAIAASVGAEVIERRDLARRGKGYALDFGVRHLTRNPPEVVLIIDADCEVDCGTIERLSRVCLDAGRPVQALYTIRSPEGAGLRTRIAEFAWLVKSEVRAVGYHRLGLPYQLLGTGMAFPWRDIETASLAGGHLQEETKLGIDFTRSGKPQLFCPEARVTSFFPVSAEGFKGQRTQWEHGHLALILSAAPRLFAEAMVNGNLRLVALLLDLCVPPLALLTLLGLTLVAGSTALFAATGVTVPLFLSAASMAMLVSSVLLSWYRHGRKVISLASLAYAPIYAIWKIPLYLKFLRRRHTTWIRTRRDGE